MVTIKGLDKLQRELAKVGKACEVLDSEIGIIRFNPNDPASIEAAILDMEQIIDERLGSCADNDVVDPIIAEVKSKYREEIVARAAEARLEGDVS